MKFEKVVSGDNEFEFETIYKSDDYSIGDVKYFKYLETRLDYGQNKSTIHVFHPAEVDGNENVSYDDTKMVAQWGCTALDGNLAEVEPGSLVMIKRESTPAGKKYYNFQVFVGKAE